MRKERQRASSNGNRKRFVFLLLFVCLALLTANTCVSHTSCICTVKAVTKEVREVTGVAVATGIAVPVAAKAILTQVGFASKGAHGIRTSGV